MSYINKVLNVKYQQKASKCIEKTLHSTLERGGAKGRTNAQHSDLPRNCKAGTICENKYFCGVKDFHFTLLFFYHTDFLLYF